jgi:hypothetical protein
MSNDNHTGANVGAADNGWPVRPAQTMLETYFQNPLQTQPRVQWGDQDEGVRFGPLPVNSTNREPSPLEYTDSWKPTGWCWTTHSNPPTKCQQITYKPAGFTSKSETQQIWHLCNTGTICWLQWQIMRQQTMHYGIPQHTWRSPASDEGGDFSQY